jgi:hypothetical protein
MVDFVRDVRGLAAIKTDNGAANEEMRGGDDADSDSHSRRREE